MKTTENVRALCNDIMCKVRRLLRNILILLAGFFIILQKIKTNLKKKTEKTKNVCYTHDSVGDEITKP